MSQQNLNLALEVNDVNVVLAGLSELPAKASYDLINKIKGQAMAQLTPAVQETVETKQQLLTEGQDK